MSGLENAALKGDLFRPHRSPSPARSLDSEVSGDEDRPLTHRGEQEMQGMPGTSGNRTGPKGVLADQKAEREVAKLEREIARRELISRQESTALIGATSVEEDVLRAREEGEEGNDEDGLGRWRRARMAELRGEGEMDGRVGRRGLREVGKEGFLAAVERAGWCVVLIYEPNLPRCNTLLASLLSLSLSLSPEIPLTILRARAASLGFSLLPPEDPDDPEEPPKADLDVLPTLLAYRHGELKKTWVRVDWEVGEVGVEGLLRQEGILGGGRVLGLSEYEYNDEE